MKTTNAFLLLWHQHGLEQVVHITRYEKTEQENLLRMIAGEKTIPNPLDDHYNYMFLRARYNPQRNYELWGIDCEDTSIRSEDWCAWFDNNPQVVVDMVRKNGVCFHRNSVPEKVVIQ